MSWKRTLGRVSFINCDPVFHSLEGKWQILPAPPTWLTGHLLRQDCLTAPIPTADYAANSDILQLIPDLGIVSSGRVGSVLLFGKRPIDQMRDIALPSDSSSSKSLLRWILERKSMDPRLVEMGPDLDSMLEACDGALLIGNRALSSSIDHPELVQLDLGSTWGELTNLPMVFGVFAARRDSPIDLIREARTDMYSQYESFEEDPAIRQAVIRSSSEKIGLSQERTEMYFQQEVSNKLDDHSRVGLSHFLAEVCDMTDGPTWFDLD